MARQIRVLISKLGLDGHDVGARIVAQKLKDAGMEVVYLGRFQTPDTIVRAALQEDVDVIGLSIHSGEQVTMMPKMVAKMREAKLDNVLLLVGGIFPKQDSAPLKAMGVDGVFMGSLTPEIVDFIRANAGRKTAKA